MIRSMTGYGRAEEVIEGRNILVEIKSVNHRYYEFSARTPRAYGYLEEKLKSFLQGKISRGKVEVGVSIQKVEGADSEVAVNRELAREYVEALRGIREEFSLTDDLSLSAVARFPDVFTVRKAVEDEEVIWAGVQTVAARAVEKFVAMRETEGAKMRADIEGRLDFIARTVADIEERAPQTVEDYRARLYAKMEEVLQNTQIDDQRILAEAALFADRVAVDEETVRLKSHVEQFREILTHDEPVGRKLDFLTQEVNRETNTIGSKAQNLEIARMVVELKSEIEKIREQIQNIE
ncbi:MAG: YicC/YloC family endoribonuclease [Oscillospiraceae bacterium]|nr:YicC/YloC family endoribonuclease [Oscillospiraceae bacterium]